MELERRWWIIRVGGALIGALGFQTLPPSRRLVAVETASARHDTVNARQDSAFAAHLRDAQQALDGINRQLARLLAGQCVKERDRMARVEYGCP